MIRSVINATHLINKLTREKHVVISINAEKTFDKRIQHTSLTDAGSIPGWGNKIPHAAGQLNLRATTTKLTCLNWSPHALEAACHN